MDLNSVDAKVFALITTATLVVVGCVKKLFPKLAEDREEVIAVLLPVLFTVIAKACHLFKATDWTTALLAAFGSGVSAGVSWDYGVKRIAGLFVGAKPDAPPPVAPGDPKS